ncbi:uncharacterized protein LOC111263494 [Varroa jacobsoni]|nr:uncharacterized protein LOC111263494 [Varroa jacobsoni]
MPPPHPGLAGFPGGIPSGGSLIPREALLMMDPYVRDQYRLRQNPFGPMGSHPGHSQGIPPNLPHALGFPPGLTPGAVMPGGLPQAWGGLKAEAEREERERKDKEQQQLESHKKVHEESLKQREREQRLLQQLQQQQQQ